MSATGQRGRAPDITVVMASHAEGDILISTLAGFERMRRHAAVHGIAVRLVLVADRATAASKAAFVRALDEGVLSAAHVDAFDVDFGSGSMARNAGVERATGRYVAIADSDNIFSENWLTEAFHTAERLGPGAIVHPAIVRNFDQDDTTWAGWSSNHPVIRPWLLAVHNFWDASCLARRDAFRDVPYPRSGPAFGLGPGDWWWNLDALAAGYTHEVAPETVFYYRVKSSGSNVTLSSVRSLVGPTPFLRDPVIAADALAAAGETADAWEQIAAEAHRTERALTPAILADWADAHRIEPLIPHPAEEVVPTELPLGVYAGKTRYATLYWAIMSHLVGGFDVVALVGSSEAATALLADWSSREPASSVAVLVLDESAPHAARPGGFPLPAPLAGPFGERGTVIAAGGLEGGVIGEPDLVELLGRVVIQSGAGRVWFGEHPVARAVASRYATALATVTTVLDG